MTEAFFCKKCTLGVYYTNTIYSTSKRVRFRLAAITSSKICDQLCNGFGLLNMWQMTTIRYLSHSRVWPQFAEQSHGKLIADYIIALAPDDKSCLLYLFYLCNDVIAPTKYVVNSSILPPR